MRPEIVCLCGSTRFYDAFQRANYEETMAGKIVLSVGFYPHSSEQAHGETIGITPEQKEALDQLHKHKIYLADEVYVLNVGGYIGDSTRSEIAFAEALGKPIRYLEDTPLPHVLIAVEDERAAQLCDAAAARLRNGQRASEAVETVARCAVDAERKARER